jgi:hypothetical protein
MMAEKKTEKKTALLLLPQQLTQQKNILRSLHITKNVQGVKYDIAELDSREMLRLYSNLPNQAKQGLYGLTPEGLYRMEDEIIKRHKLQKSGVQLSQFLKPAYARKLQEHFEFFKPFVHLVKWYHQLPNATTGNMVTAPCSFSNYKPFLKFEVVKEKEGLIVQTIVTINGADYALNNFNRFHFLLESKNEYFLLASKDYQTLEWLVQKNPLQYSDDAPSPCRKYIKQAGRKLYGATK